MDQKSRKLNFRPAGAFLFFAKFHIINTSPGALHRLATARLPIQTGNNCKWPQQGVSPMTRQVIPQLKSIGAALQHNGRSVGLK